MRQDPPDPTPQTPSQEASTTSGSQPPANERPTPVGARDIKVFLKADEVTEAIAKRLAGALVRSVSEAQALAICASIEPEGVRTSEPATPASAVRLAVPDSARSQLGMDLKTHLVVSPGSIRIWLTEADRIEPGSTVTLVALAADGRTVATTAIVTDPRSPIRLALPWTAELPGEIALGISALS